VALRNLARAKARIVVLHTHPHDAVPVAAFAHKNSPPVAYVNHADHAFWLGCSVADIVLDIRESGHRITLEQRQARASEILPLPLDDPPVLPPKNEARSVLGIPLDARVYLTIGSAYKYVPCWGRDFFRDISEMLEKDEHAVLHCVGISKSQASAISPYACHPNMVFHGIQVDTTIYMAAANVYVEGYPMGSLTAFMEAVQSGLPALRAPLDPVDVLVAGNVFQEADPKKKENPQNIIDYFKGKQDNAITDVKSCSVYKLLGAHTGSSWQSSCMMHTSKLDKISHTVMSLNEATPQYDRFNAAISEFHYNRRKFTRSSARKVLYRNRWIRRNYVWNIMKTIWLVDKNGFIMQYLRDMKYLLHYR
jgi:hypothetical protein